jgi:hypothetical protein
METQVHPEGAESPSWKKPLRSKANLPLIEDNT